MKKTEIIKKNYEFKNFFSKGKRYCGKYISIYIFHNNLEINKLGIAVGKKVTNSVGRHRIRRLIKENYILLENEISCGKNILIVWNKNVKSDDAEFYAIKEEMQGIFKKAGVI